MKTSSLVWIVLAAVLVFSLVAIWFAPSVQDYLAGNRMWNGIHDFSREFKSGDLELLSQLPESTGGVLIEIPYTAYAETDLQQIQKYISRGNTLVLMDDLGYGNSVLEYLGLSVRFTHTLLLDPLFCYKNAYLPRITSFSDPLDANGIRSLTLNHATFLDSVDSASVIAWSSNESFADRNGDGDRDKEESPGPFPVAAEFTMGAGRVEIVSDPSLIINTMLDQSDNNKFIRYILQRSGVPSSIVIDRSHLSLAPLDTTKTGLQKARHFIAHPYFLLLLVALVFVFISRYSLKKGETIGKL